MSWLQRVCAFNPAHFSPPFLKWSVPQGYVTVSEINELYAKLGVETSHAPFNLNAPERPDSGSDPSPSPEDGSAPSGEDEVCDAAFTH